MKRKVLYLLGIVGVVPIFSCELGPVACPLSVEPGIVVEIRDSVTSAPAAAGAVAQAVSGDRVATLSPADELEQIAWVPPGTYRLEITKAGYADWSRANIAVRSSGGDCPQSMTVTVQAKLQPSS